MFRANIINQLERKIVFKKVDNKQINIKSNMIIDEYASRIGKRLH